ATCAFTHCGPMTRSPSFDGFVDRFSRFSFLPPDYPSYRGPDFYPGGTCFPLNNASLRWTHPHAGLSRRTSRAARGNVRSATPTFSGGGTKRRTVRSADGAY